jgi:hypothetical protein
MLVPNFLKENVKVPNKLIYNDQDILGMGKKLRKKKMPAFSIYSDLQEGSTQSKTHKRRMSSSHRQKIHNKIVQWPNSTTVSAVLSPINHPRN